MLLSEFHRESLRAMILQMRIPEKHLSLKNYLIMRLAMNFTPQMSL